MVALISRFTTRGLARYLLPVVSLLMLASNPVSAIELKDGIVLESTRVIYPGNAENGVTFRLSNRSQQTYLLQSRIFPWQAATEPAEEAPAQSGTLSDSLDPHQVGASTPFMVLPPLVHFAPEEELTLRLRLIENRLAADRESVFTLALKAIPSQSSGSQDSSKLVLALQNNLKLFFRPKGMAVLSAQQRSDKLQFSCTNRGLSVSNPSSYFVTLAELTIDNQQVPMGDKRMIAPFSAEVYPIQHCGGQMLSWQIINDEGFNTPQQSKKLDRKR